MIIKMSSYFLTNRQLYLYWNSILINVSIESQLRQIKLITISPAVGDEQEKWKISKSWPSQLAHSFPVVVIWNTMLDKVPLCQYS